MVDIIETTRPQRENEFFFQNHTNIGMTEEFKRLIDVDIKIDGVIGLCHFGDPHVDDDGTNLHELFGI